MQAAEETLARWSGPQVWGPQALDKALLIGVFPFFALTLTLTLTLTLAGAGAVVGAAALALAVAGLLVLDRAAAGTAAVVGVGAVAVVLVSDIVAAADVATAVVGHGAVIGGLIGLVAIAAKATAVIAFAFVTGTNWLKVSLRQHPIIALLSDFAALAPWLITVAASFPVWFRGSPELRADKLTFVLLFFLGLLPLWNARWMSSPSAPRGCFCAATWPPAGAGCG